jgi:hypothetical protein
MDRENITSTQLEVLETLENMLKEKSKRYIQPLYIQGNELKNEFKRDIRNDLYELSKQGLIERREGLNDYLLTTKNHNGTQRGNS